MDPWNQFLGSNLSYDLNIVSYYEEEEEDIRLTPTYRNVLMNGNYRDILLGITRNRYEGAYEETNEETNPNEDANINEDTNRDTNEEANREADRGITVCPICSQSVSSREIGYHILDNHPALFTVMLSTYLNPLVGTFQTPLDEIDDVEDNGFDLYSYYSNLCDSIGYETVGVDNIDASVPKIDEVEPDTKCPICLETFEENEREFRRVNNCKHEFCQDCTQTWFSKHKKCPVCMQEVQMAERSISSSPSANSIASSALSVSSIPST